MNDSLNTPTITLRTWLIVITVMTIAILEVLDSTVVNVALTDMMASLGANSDQITWILTSYVVASAIMIPLTGFLSDRIGMKQLLITNQGIGVLEGYIHYRMNLVKILTILPK